MDILYIVNIIGVKDGSECSSKWYMNSDELVQIGYVIGNVQ